jgi:hypothetical protein
VTIVFENEFWTCEMQILAILICPNLLGSKFVHNHKLVILFYIGSVEALVNITPI